MIKKCKICEKEFKQFKSTDKFCSTRCALADKIIKDHKKKQKQYKKEWNERKEVLRSKVKLPEYKKSLQTEINKLSRMIDAHFKYKCIDCNEDYTGQIDAAHFKDVGGNNTIRYNLHNIHSSRAYCNRYSNDHKTGYEIGIESRYGLEYLEQLKELTNKYTYIKFNYELIKTALKTTRSIIRNFEDEIKLHSNGKESREYFNNKIGIYNNK
jgi:hypothetical protein